MNPNAALSTRRLESGTSIVQAEAWQATAVTLTSPALAVMTDLTKVKAATTPPGTGLKQAEQQMIVQGVRMLFVVAEMPAVIGLITSSDLGGDRVMRLVQQRGVRHDELVVVDVMVGLSELDAIGLDAMRIASVANVIATLKKHGRNHLLVIGDAPGTPRICGVISRTQVERQLGRVIEMVEVAGSFAEIGQMLS